MSRDEIFDHLESMWSDRDPMPEGLVERMQALVAAEVTMALTDLDYELMMLIERSAELAGTRGGADTGTGTAYTLRFGTGDLDLLVRAGGRNGGGTTRLDGWVVPPAELTVRATRIAGTASGGDAEPEQSWETAVDAQGRFELTDLPAGLYRLWLTPADADARPFGTPAFEI
jgi:hypothetical protein